MTTKQFLFLSFETTTPRVETAQLQHIGLTFAEGEETLSIMKEMSCFIQPYTPQDFFDSTADIPQQGEVTFKHEHSYSSQTCGYTLSITSEQIVSFFAKAFSKAQYIVMHNAEGYGLPLLKKLGVDVSNKQIIDTSQHIPYPAKIVTRNLVHLCAEHNFVPYRADAFGSDDLKIYEPRTLSANRALLTLINLYTLDAVLKAFTKEHVIISAHVSFDQNALLKQLGFHFDRETKQWQRRVDEEQYKFVVGTLGVDAIRVVTPSSKS